MQSHGLKILKLEGEMRVEPCVYEAEWAYLNMYDALAKKKRGIVFMPYQSALGGMVVSNLGGHKDNYTEWNEVYSENGGKYKMTVYYAPVKKKGRE